MNTSTANGKILSTLKQQLKNNHLTYRDAAARLPVSEATIKRYFSGKGVSVDILQKMAEVAGLDFFPGSNGAGS